MTTLIVQPTPNTCGLACLAMAANKFFEELWGEGTGKEIYDKCEEEKTLTGTNLDRAYIRAGFIYEANLWKHYSDHDRPESIHKMLQGRRALLTVVSLNVEKGQHMLYWDGFKIWDPSPLQVYSWLRQVRPIWTTLII